MATREEQLRGALAGLTLSADEERLVAWAGRILDFWTINTLCGLLGRVRGVRS